MGQLGCCCVHDDGGCMDCFKLRCWLEQPAHRRHLAAVAQPADSMCAGGEMQSHGVAQPPCCPAGKLASICRRVLASQWSHQEAVWHAELCEGAACMQRCCQWLQDSSRALQLECAMHEPPDGIVQGASGRTPAFETCSLHGILFSSRCRDALQAAMCIR